MLQFQVATDIPPAPARATYRPDDYVLVVGPDREAPTGAARASLDTLTLLFSPAEHRLLGLDAYTSSERWEQRALLAPVVDQEASLDCVAAFDAHGIARVDAGPVRYTYSPADALLWIQLDDEVATRVRCLTCLVGGLNADGELVELWVQGVEGVRRP